MKKLITLLAIALTAGSVQAGLPSLPPMKKISPLVLNYLRTTGCLSDTALDPKLVTRLVDKGNQLDGYLAIAVTDAACAGGSGTSAGALVFVRPAELAADQDDLDSLKVDPLISEPVAMSKMSSRAITSLYQKEGQLFATSLEYGPNDGNCCPSIKSVSKVILTKKTVSVGKDDSRSLYTWDFVKTK